MELKLHQAQLKVFNAKAKVKLVCAGRGLGKSRLLLTTAVFKCLTYTAKIDPASPQTAAILMPSFKQARGIHWGPLLAILEKCPLVKTVNKSDFRISFKGSRPDLILRGCDNSGDRLRGLNLIWVGIDEFQDVNPKVWPEVVVPALARNPDWEALIIGTPKGRSSYFFKLHEQAKSTQDWLYFHFKTANNPFFPKHHLENARHELPPKVYRQEFEASWEDFSGQIFDQINEELIVRNQEVELTPAPLRQVFLGCDFGDINPCLVVVGLSTHQGYYLLDYWQNQNECPVPEADLLRKAAELCHTYNIYRCYLPDDRPASVISFRRYGSTHRLPGMARSIQVRRGKPGPMERALILNNLFYQRRLFFTKNTACLYDKFASYHRAKDKDGNLLNCPASGQDDHAIDAAAYAIATLEYKYDLNVPN